MTDLYAPRVKEAADRVAAAMKAFIPEEGHDGRDRHGLLGDFALLRNWGEKAARDADADYLEGLNE